MDSESPTYFLTWVDNAGWELDIIAAEDRLSRGMVDFLRGGLSSPSTMAK
jgi:hypothetical protein